MKSLFFFLILLSGYANAQPRTENLCSEKQGACVLYKTLGTSGNGVFLTGSATTYNAVKAESPFFSLSLIDEAMFKIEQATADSTKTFSTAEEDAAEIALDEFKSSAGACVGAAAGCLGGMAGAGLAAVYGQATTALKAYGVGALACFVTKPNCRDMVRKWGSYRTSLAKAQGIELGGGDTQVEGEWVDDRPGQSPDFTPVGGSGGHSRPFNFDVILDECPPEGCPPDWH